MIETRTVLWVKNKSEPLETFQGRVDDPFYIYGVIHLCINGQPILTELSSDLVDQLWAYIINCAGDLARKESTFTGFPDQPLNLVFTVSTDDDTVAVKLGFRDAE